MYVAVIVSDPAASVVVDTLAVPPDTLADPKFLVPALKITDPVGAPVVLDVTVAVNVTDCPLVDGFCDDATVVIVAALFTTSDSAADVLPACVASPP